MTSGKLAYIGQIIQLDAVPDADNINVATVVCGAGGKWRGVVTKSDFTLNDVVTVYLPDAIIPQSSEGMEFMAATNWRVKMRRFRGAPSEVVITKAHLDMPVGTDVSGYLGILKYEKPIPANMHGVAKNQFPRFVPKTDELNYQTAWSLVEALDGKPYYITQKCDGSSTTAYKHNGEFGVCSRNFDLEESNTNGFWLTAKLYNLEVRLPEGVALQWETCGPGIQKNPMGLRSIEGFAFSAYDIGRQRYYNFAELCGLCDQIEFPMAKILEVGDEFDMARVMALGTGTYDNGKPQEGVVVRSQKLKGHAPISFKVINLDYKG